MLTRDHQVGADVPPLEIIPLGGLGEFGMNMMVIACGDTANDCALYTRGFLGVVVGNALDELKALDAPCIYHANGNFAAGVQEGIAHWLAKAEPALAVNKSA